MISNAALLLLVQVVFITTFILIIEQCLLMTKYFTKISTIAVIIYFSRDSYFGL